MGRISVAKSGAEARGETAQIPLSASLPHRQTYQYDEFNHLRVRNNLNWDRDTFQGKSFNLNFNIVNDRVIGQYQYDWQYDADGRNTQSGAPDVVTSSIYDAAGKMIQIYESSPAVYTQRFYDGTGQELKTRAWLPSAPEDIKTKYFIRSTVLGGEIISETLGDGRKLKTSVIAAGTVIARHDYYLFGEETGTCSRIAHPRLIRSRLPSSINISFLTL